MNLGELKAFVGDKPNQLAPDQQLKQQLQEIGLRQASKYVNIGANGTTTIVSSQTTVGLRVYNNSLNQTLSLDQKQANLPNPKEKNASLFDFEEVAKNVLRFVGGAIKQAASKGADEESLLKMFEQARSGVLKGIELAEKDLAGFMNEEIENGISNSQKLIEQGIQSLQEKLLGNGNGESESSIEKSAESIRYERQDSGDLIIRTRDGDEVSISFEDSRQFELNRSLLSERAFTQPVEPDPVVSKSDDNLPVANNEAAETESENVEQTAVVEPDTNIEEEKTQSNVQQLEQSAFYYERSALSFSVKGELDEEELNAIADLVGDANDLADTFFSGDIESAFQQALDIGYDSQELAGFALQLTRQEQVEVVKAYESVSHFNDESNQQLDPVSAVKPISQYLEKMLNVLEQSQQQLEDGNAYENLINGIVNQLQDVGTNDLLSAINQFHSFNKRLLNALPSSQDDQQS